MSVWQRKSRIGLVALVACGSIVILWHSILKQTPFRRAVSAQTTTPEMLDTGTSPKQMILPLYGDSAIPNSKNVRDREILSGDSVRKVSRPTIQVFLPARAKATGASVLIFPGGGYVGEVMGREGTSVAEFLQDYGIAAIVVKYRLPSDETMLDKTLGPLQDGQQAIRLVRQNAKNWELDPERVGVIGFSVGGHIAASMGTHFQTAYVPNPDHIDLRPNFMVLVYPVITMETSRTHADSRRALLGDSPDDEKVKFFSNELQVTDQTPPTLLLQAADDHMVDVDNSISFFEALRHHNVPVDMRIFKSGDHGLIPLKLDKWEPLIPEWIAENGWMRGPS